MDSSELAKHTAPATAAGFLFQFQRAVQVLAEAPNGATLGIETLDDLTTEYRTGERILEQDKFRRFFPTKFHRKRRGSSLLRTTYAVTDLLVRFQMQKRKMTL